MKDIKKEKQEKVNWLGRLETAGELASGGLFLMNLLGRSAPATRVVPYVGPAVGMPTNGVIPNASQAFRGLVEGTEAALPAIGAEELAVGAAGATVAEAVGAGASMLIPGVGLGLAALAAGSGLYYYAKKHLDENPDDRRGKILIDNMEMRQQRAESLTNSMFSDGSFAQAFSV